jgi:hypothetical protein
VPSVIHEIHTTLGHPSATATIKNFQAYYYHRHAAKLIRVHVRSCITCAFAGKYDIRKAAPSADRTLQPTHPRQYLYCDVLPMPKGQFGYILFGLDAYSQYVYTIPMKDKTTTSVYNAFLTLFSTTGWYEALYLDNETSFQAAAKMLVKIAPIAVHYSTPYCHFQNNAENYIKSFKRCFLKMLNDPENPHHTSDWAQLLPTVTQALNRRVILSLGISREAIHFNSPSCYYPLAEMPATDDAVDDLDQLFDAINPNIYQKIKQTRANRLRKNTRKVPVYYVNQLVFAVDHAPSSAGVTSILKLPTNGPFRITALDARNVTLIDIESGKTYQSHVNYIRPINLSEFKLILNKKWDLHAQFTKSAQPPRTRSHYDTAPAPADKTAVMENENFLPDIEDEIGLDNLMYPPPETTQNATPPAPSHTTLAPSPAAESAPDEVPDEFADFNSHRINDELSQQYRKRLEKRVTFHSHIATYFQ